MKITIITSEPLGSYHLAPLYQAMKKSSAHFTHLIPYPEKTQGEPWLRVTSDLSIIKDTDKLIVAGGGFSAWSQAIISQANRLGVPVILTELALGGGFAHQGDLTINGYTVIGEDSKKLLLTSGIKKIIEVTGTPQLDSILPWKPSPNSFLLLSTSARAERDPSELLFKVGSYLVDKGHQVTVRPRPREDKSIWNGFIIDNSPNITEVASGSSIVVAYPGTPVPIVAATGVPIIGCVPNLEFKKVLSINQNKIFSNWVSELRSFGEIVSTAKPADPFLVKQIVGPIGDSANRIVNYWLNFKI